MAFRACYGRIWAERFLSVCVSAFSVPGICPRVLPIGLDEEQKEDMGAGQAI